MVQLNYYNRNTSSLERVGGPRVPGEVNDDKHDEDLNHSSEAVIGSPGVSADIRGDFGG